MQLCSTEPNQTPTSVVCQRKKSQTPTLSRYLSTATPPTRMRLPTRLARASQKPCLAHSLIQKNLDSAASAIAASTRRAAVRLPHYTSPLWPPPAPHPPLLPRPLRHLRDPTAPCCASSSATPLLPTPKTPPSRVADQSGMPPPPSPTTHPIPHGASSRCHAAVRGSIICRA